MVTSRLFAFATSFFAVFIVTVAILLSVVRIGLPEIDELRPKIETWLSEFLDRPAEIGAVSASWKGWSPTIRIRELVLSNKSGSAELVRFEYASLELSLLRTLKQRKPVPRHLVVGGVALALERDADGNISIAGMPPSRWPVAQWVLEQDQFTLADAEVSFTDHKNSADTVDFTGVSLSVTQLADARLIEGGLRRRADLDSKVEFSLKVRGDVLGSHWDGELFVDASGIDLTEVFDKAGLTDSSIGAARADARIWSDWEQSRLMTARASINSSALSNNTPENALPDFQATCELERLKDGWALSLLPLTLHYSNGESSANEFSMRWRKAKSSQPLIAMRGRDLDIADLTRFSNFTNNGENPIGIVSDAQLSGEIKELLLAIRTSNEATPHFLISTQLAALRTREFDRFPGIDGLNVRLRANDTGGSLSFLPSAGIQLESNEWLQQALQISALSGSLRWDKQADSLKIASSGIRAQVEAIDLSILGDLVLHDENPAIANLVAEIHGGPLTRLGRLVPKNKLPPRGDRWMRTAFKSGDFKHGHALLRGPLAKFPFDDGGGSFKVKLDLADVDLRYSERWPQADALDATVTIDNRQMKTAIHTGRIYAADVSGAIIESSDLFTRRPVYRVQGRTKVSAADLKKLIATSPLQNGKAVRFNDVNIDKHIDMSLEMSLGLYPDGEKELLGLAQFDGNEISHSKHNITLNDVTGDISFTRDEWYGEGLSALYDGERVGVVLNGGLDDPNYDTEFRMTGTSNAEYLIKSINRYVPVLGEVLSRNENAVALSGELPWKAVLTIPEANGHDTRVPQRLSIESSLFGLEVDLPWPFGKSSAERKPLAITTYTYSGGERDIRVDFGKTLDMELRQKKSSDGVYSTERAEFIFGADNPTFERRPGLHVSGNIGRLPLGDWIAFARSADDGMPQRQNLPVTFDLHVDTLEYLNRRFSDIELRGDKQATAWAVQFESADATGAARIPHDGSELQLTFEHLKLAESSKDVESRTREIDPKLVRPFQLRAQSLHVGELDLGQAELITARAKSGLRMEHLSLEHPAFSLQGSGEWLLEDDVQQSQIKLAVSGGSLAGLLKGFNYEVANIDGGNTAIRIDAVWGGMPSAFSLDRLKGSLSLTVEKGRFLDIEPGGGRLFGLLSLQTLPRRLSLDFNDLFRKGFTFDSIEGSFELDRGNAYTNSLLMNGPSARINVAGRTGLADQDYDQHVTVTPTLSNSIPVAGALFGPAGIGVGAVIYLGQKMFKSIPEQVDKILSREYSVTGNWQEPLIERI